MTQRLLPIFRSAMISLTRQEQQLQNILLDVAKYINESKEIKNHLELRFAGGWVRDKLLGIPSNDIDTAINSMTGKAYGQKVEEFLSVPGHREKHGLSEDDIGHFHVIEANQEKSKHLETVTVSLLGLDLDFVNLRTETYSEDSRNPQMEFGTPEEDAMRRDATINALFYNLHTGQVEDYVGGLSDLKSKIIRTPVKPYQTFMDDPLRVLRLIRFASRLGFSIDSETEASMKHPNVLDSLRSGAKISRERVGTEVEKMLKGKNPCDSLRLFDRLGLYSTIFTYQDSKGQEVPQPETIRWKTAYDCLATIRLDVSPHSLNKTLIQVEKNEDAVYHSWMLAALTPWATISSPLSAPGRKLEDPPATQAIKGGMKSSTSLCNVITGAIRNLPEIAEWKKAVLDQQPSIEERDNLAMAIRRWDRIGGDWKLPVLFAILVEAMEKTTSGEFESVFQGWQQFLDHLRKLNIMDAPSCPPLVNGDTLLEALDKKPGKWTAGALEVCMKWQFRNPGVNDYSAAIEEVKARREELGIPEGGRGDAGAKAGKRRKKQQA